MKTNCLSVGLAAVGLLLAACGGASSQIQPTPTSDTFDDGYAPVFERAPMEFDCPAQDMTYKLLSNPNQVSAEGCGKRGIYVLAGYSGFVLNSVTELGSGEAPETGTVEMQRAEPDEESASPPSP